MNIGWFSYAPGLHGVMRNSAGNSEWTRHVIDLYNKAGHTVTWLADEKPPAGTVLDDNLKHLNVAIFNWRWEMPDYPERQALYEKQLKVLDTCFLLKKKVIVHDQDHKISDTDLEWLKLHNVDFYAPELNPKPGFNKLFYPNPHKQLYAFRNKSPFMSATDLCYIGNVYERYAQAVEYFSKISNDHNVSIFGNWLEKGPDRPGEKVVKADLPKVYFGGRLQQKNVIEQLASATATIHLFKPSYADVGFITFRWVEAAVAHTLAFIPSEFWLPEKIKESWNKLGIIINDGNDVANQYKNMTIKNWKDGVVAQRDFILSISNSQQWLDILETDYV
jgi:hypothetical protein